MSESIFSLKNKYVLITGALGLLGSQHVLAVAEAGGVPIMVDLDENKIKERVSNLKNSDIFSIGIKCDITSESSIIELRDELIKKDLPLCGVINNAAINPEVKQNKISLTRIENTSVDEISSHFNVGFIGPFLIAKHIHPIILEKNPNNGVVLNISSDLGLIAPKQSLYSDQNDMDEEKKAVKPLAYSIVKTGLLGFTRYLATYYGGKLRCNALCPGGVFNKQPTEFVEKLVKEIPLGRMATKEEYKGAIIFLLSDASKYMNGSVVQMDGGRCTW